MFSILKLLNASHDLTV